jgi:pyridoxamine 5'-phosphate oxidase
MRQFDRWFRAAKRAGIHEPNAMTLATADAKGRVSARMVLLKGTDERGFQFFTNYASRKGREMAENSRVALVFYWKEVNRQVRVTGRVSKLSAHESDAYFDSRPLGSRFAAMASTQSRVIASWMVLEEKVKVLTKLHPDGMPPRPLHWGGYCVHPDEIEFWQQGQHRLHDRLVYRKTKHAWKLERLAP